MKPPADPDKVWRAVVRMRREWCNMVFGEYTPPSVVLVVENAHFCPEPEKFGPPAPTKRK